MVEVARETDRGIAYCRVVATVKDVTQDSGILIYMSELNVRLAQLVHMVELALMVH